MVHADPKLLNFMLNAKIIFKTLLKISPNLCAMFILRKVTIQVPMALEKIEAIKDFPKISQEKRWDTLLHLFSFAIYAIIKILTSEYKNEKNTKKVLEIVNDKIIYFLAHYKKPDLLYNKFVAYIDTSFEQKFKNFDKFSLDIKEENNIVCANSCYIAGIYNTQISNELKKVIANLYLNTMRIII